MSWPLVKLSDICNLFNGYAFKSGDYVESSNTMSCRMSNIRPGGEFNIDYNARYLPDNFVEKHSSFLLKDGDVIIAMTDLAGSPKILGVPTVVHSDGRNILLNQRVGKLEIIDSEKVYFPYLRYALSDPKVRSIYKKFAGGGLQINLGKDDLLSVEIPLPPLETQKKIAAVLEKADLLRKDCKQMEQELNSLAQSVFIDMFGSQAKGYSEWPIHRIEELAEDKKGSMRTGPFGSDLKHSEFVGEGIAVIGIDNAVKNEFAWGERRFITSEKYEKLKRYRVYSGDLIITIMGTTGRIAVVPEDIPLSISTKHLAVITLDKDKIKPEFLAIAIKTHPDLLNQIRDSNKGAIMDGLNLGLIKALKLRLPSLSLQIEYLKTLQVIQERIFESRASHIENNDFFNALMQKAFKGELNL